MPLDNRTGGKYYKSIFLIILEYMSECDGDILLWSSSTIKPKNQQEKQFQKLIVNKEKIERLQEQENRIMDFTRITLLFRHISRAKSK